MLLLIRSTLASPTGVTHTTLTPAMWPSWLYNALIIVFVYLIWPHHLYQHHDKPSLYPISTNLMTNILCILSLPTSWQTLTLSNLHQPHDKHSLYPVSTNIMTNTHSILYPPTSWKTLPLSCLHQHNEKHSLYPLFHQHHDKHSLYHVSTNIMTRTVYPVSTNIMTNTLSIPSPPTSWESLHLSCLHQHHDKHSVYPISTNIMTITLSIPSSPTSWQTLPLSCLHQNHEKHSVYPISTNIMTNTPSIMSPPTSWQAHIPPLSCLYQHHDKHTFPLYQNHDKHTFSLYPVSTNINMFSAYQPANIKTKPYFLFYCVADFIMFISSPSPLTNINSYHCYDLHVHTCVGSMHEPISP